MEYLLFLQQLREGAPAILNESILFISEFMGGTGALAFMALVYWCINKKAGSFMLMNFSGAYMMNQTLKNIFCVSRPFLLDSRLHPYKQATGYSFPSGHTMLGTAVYSSTAIWQRNRKWVVALCAVLTLLTAFGRNWIGVHTPQDVLVGMFVSLLVVGFQYRTLNRLEQNPQKDVLILSAGLLWAGAVLLLMPGSGKVCGIYLGVCIGWFIERRWIRFEIPDRMALRAASYFAGMAAVLVFNKFLVPALASPLEKDMQNFLIHFVTFFMVSAGWPGVLRLAKRI